MINYEEIIENLDDDKVKRLLDSLDIPYEDKETHLIMPTACHNEDLDEASPKLYYYKNTHIFQCFTECGAMSIFTFLKHYYETRDYAYDWYQDIYQVVLDCSAARSFTSNPNSYKSIKSNYTEKKSRQELPDHPPGIMNAFIKYYPIEWINDGITPATMDKFNIRYSPSQNKIIIPHYDARGRLVGIRGRALNAWEAETFGKYMPIQIEGKWYSHPLSLNLYGLNMTKDAIRKTGIAYIGEAEKFVLQLDSFSIPNCGVAVCGSKLNKYALDILVRECHPKEIVVCFDQEEDGRAYTYFNHLYEMCKKYSNYANFSFIYDKRGLLKLKDSPTDKGEEVFKQLLKERVKL